MTPPQALLPGLEPAAPVAPGARARHICARRERLDPSKPVELQAKVMRKDVKLKLRLLHVRQKPRKRERGEIRGFSADAARRLREFIRNTEDLWTTAVTLTYPGPSFGFAPEALDGRKAKAHVHAFCTWLTRQQIAYVWVLEFQARGVPHFHFLIRGRIPKDVLSSKWYAIVGSADPRHLAAGTEIHGLKDPEHAGAYLGSYMAKLLDKKGHNQKAVPAEFKSVGRFWGASRCLSATFVRQKVLYADAARELRTWRKLNQGSRRGISADQLRAAERLRAEAARYAEKRPDLAERKLRAAARCERRAQTFIKRWRWRGFGFTLLRGAGSFKAQLDRQALLHDTGVDLSRAWEEWDGKPDPKPAAAAAPPPDDSRESPWNFGQYLIVGGCEDVPAHRPWGPLGGALDG